MDKPTWQAEYKRLLTAYGKTVNQEQMALYYDVLQSYPGPVVTAAVSAAIRDGRSWPSAADLADRARQSRMSHPVPVGTCDVCHNETWIILPCAGVAASGPTEPPLPVNRREYCGRSYVHADHDYAVRCTQCWTHRAAVA